MPRLANNLERATRASRESSTISAVFTCCAILDLKRNAALSLFDARAGRLERRLTQTKLRKRGAAQGFEGKCNKSHPAAAECRELGQVVPRDQQRGAHATARALELAIGGQCRCHCRRRDSTSAGPGARFAPRLGLRCTSPPDCVAPPPAPALRPGETRRPPWLHRSSRPGR